jgi:hypothetical protein
VTVCRLVLTGALVHYVRHAPAPARSAACASTDKRKPVVPSSSTLIITSHAALFPPDGFGPSLSRNAAGAFQTSYTVPTSTPPGTYTIGLRCDGGNLGVGATLRVTGE